MRKLWGAPLIVACALAFTGCAVPAASSTLVSTTATSTATPTSRPTPTPTAQAVTVVSITDGDTVETSAGTVRLIGIDAPENGSWGYAEAGAALGGFLAGGPVTLVKIDGGDATDRYGRLLRYVRVNGQDAGRHMIGTGWAIARYDSRDGYGRHPLESDYVTADASHEMPAPPAPPAPAPEEPAPAAQEPAPAAPPAPEPAPRSASYANCTEARAAGVTPLYRGDPGYASKLDRDGDGIACE